MVAVKLSQEAEVLEYKEKSSLSFIKFFSVFSLSKGSTTKSTTW